MVEAGIKLSSKDTFIPITLLENIVEDSDFTPITIEESDSELFFKTYHGIGQIKFKNGSEYEGNVRYGIMQSTPDHPSIMKFKNGTLYRGDMLQNRITGQGEYIFPEGSTYVGEVLNGLRHGKGVYENREENLKYEGYWHNGLKHGKGILTINDMVYDGDFFEGAKHNFGKLKWLSSGNYYEGEFKENQICGNGYMVWMDSNEKYIGQWKDNRQNGFGLHIWYEPKGELKYLKNRYIGEWKNGLRHGFGIFFYSNGSKYEGMWEENLKNGFGIFIFQDGTQYIGKFHNDRMLEYNMQGIQSSIDYSSLHLGNNSNPNQGGTVVTPHIKTGSMTTVSSNLGTTAPPNNKPENRSVKKSINSEITVVNKFTTILEDPRENPDYNNPNNKGNLGSIDNNKLGNYGGKKILPPVDKKVSNINSISNSNPRPSENNVLNSGGARYSRQPSDISVSNPVARFGAVKPNYRVVEPINEGDESYSQSDQVVANRILKESEPNPFSSLLDITDILENEPELEKSLVEVQNVLLRYISDLKMLYKVYSGNKEAIDRLNESNMFGMKTTGEEDSFKTLKEVHKTPSMNKGGKMGENKEPKESNKIESIITEGLNINADIGYAMEMKDVWKMLRDTSLLTPEFTLADFNRLYYKGPRNYNEIFAIPDDLGEDLVFDYLFSSTSAAKDGFMQKYYKNGKYENNINVSKINKFTFKIKGRIFEFDIHSKRNVVLMRQFYESVVRIAYLRFQNSNEQLSKKVKDLLENYLKPNPKFKIGKKNLTNTNKESSSVNSSLMEPVYKNLETVLDMIISSREAELLGLFKQIVKKSKLHIIKNDLTLTYRSFYDLIIKADIDLNKSIDKYVYCVFINKYHSNKLTINEETKNNIQTISYIENLLDIEMIFYEFCELLCLVIRKYCLDFKFEEKKENVDEVYNKIKQIIVKVEPVEKNKEKYKYFFPELPYHREYWALIQEKKQREFEERKKKKELERFERENKMMEYYDARLIEIPFEEEEEEDEDEYYD